MPVVKAKINDEELNFLFDSGAPYLILNSAYYTDTLKGVAVSNAKGVSGEISMSTYKVNKLEFAGIKTDSIDVMCASLKHLEKRVRIHGLIGYDVIKDFDVMYNYENKTITLINKKHAQVFIDSIRQKGKVDEIPMQQQKHVPYVTVTINNKAYTMGIDSGASSNLMNAEKFDEIKPLIKSIKSTNLSGGNEGKVRRQRGKVKEMNIGSTFFKNVPTVFSDINHLNTIWDVKYDGLIGRPILSKHKCIVSYHTKTLMFIK